MSYPGEMRVFLVELRAKKKILKQSWVFAKTDEEACDEVAGRDVLPFAGILTAELVPANEELFFCCDDPHEAELVYPEVPDWEPDPEPRAGFVVTKLKSGKYRVSALAWIWAEAYEETLGQPVFSYEPKVLCSR